MTAWQFRYSSSMPAWQCHLSVAVPHVSAMESSYGGRHDSLVVASFAVLLLKTGRFLAVLSIYQLPVWHIRSTFVTFSWPFVLQHFSSESAAMCCCTTPPRALSASAFRSENLAALLPPAEVILCYSNLKILAELKKVFNCQHGRVRITLLWIERPGSGCRNGSMMLATTAWRSHWQLDGTITASNDSLATRTAAAGRWQAGSMEADPSRECFSRPI